MTRTSSITHRQLVKGEWRVYTQELRRRLLSGLTVPVETVGRTWQDVVAPAPMRLGEWRNTAHPSRKHDGDKRRPAEMLVAHPAGLHTRSERRRRARSTR